jgi:hypothetical protein
MRNSFALYELSRAEMSVLGLADEYGDLTIDPEDLETLLTGRRTDLMRLRNLSCDGMQISELDAKLSLHRDAEGQAIIRVHPVYHKPKIPFALENSDAQALIDGRQLHARYTLATATAGNEASKEFAYILEYDPETREFMSYEPKEVLVPDHINGFELSRFQKNDFSNGNIVALPDGTNLVHKATDSKGLLSNRWSLIISKNKEDGKIYELLEGIRPLKGEQLPDESLAFQKEYAAMKTQLQETIQATFPAFTKRGR